MLLSLVQPQTNSIELLNAFLFAHTLVIVNTFWNTGVPGFGYVAALLLGFVPRYWNDPWIDLAILTAVYLLVHEGLWRSLARFPWATEGHTSSQAEILKRQEEEFGPPCGWPYDRFLRDVKTAAGISRIEAVLISMLAGWWVFALQDWLFDRFAQPVVMILVFQTLLLRRGMLYLQGYAPPISLAGRIATFRWIIPGYDRALLVFLLALVAMPAVPVLGMLFLGVHPRASLPVLVGLMVLIALITPPSLRNWRLTGRHRLVAAIPKNSRDFVQIG